MDVDQSKSWRCIWRSGNVKCQFCTVNRIPCEPIPIVLHEYAIAASNAYYAWEADRQIFLENEEIRKKKKEDEKKEEKEEVKTEEEDEEEDEWEDE
jgi:hypothetical protein